MIKIFPTSAIRRLDAYTIEHEPIASIDLMERAATALTQAVTERWDDKQTPFTVFAGPGNNGGDALAMARLLIEGGYDQVSAYLFNPKESLSADCRTNMELLALLTGVDLHVVTTQFTPPVLTDRHVVIDGLFGSGLNKPLGGGYAAVVKYINASPATVVAIDMPSGLMGEDNTYNIPAHIVHADYTFTLQMPKLSFFFAENQQYIGEWDVLDIGLSQEGIEQTPTDLMLQDPDDFASVLRPRSRFAHKGDFGRALLVAGRQGMAGASVLAAKACLRSGVGVLTVHVPCCNNAIVQTAVPEAITQLDYHDFCFAEAVDADDYQAVAVGPGLGRSADTERALLEQIEACTLPMVVDADALNILGDNRSYLGKLPKGSILTPHPKELERLVGKCQNSYERLTKAIALARNTEVYIIIKGAYSTIVSPQGTCLINPTGNPGMATAGSGDVLTGVLLALLAQGYDPESAARLGVFAHGLAGDIAAHRQGEMAMTASDIIAALPAVWSKL